MKKPDLTINGSYLRNLREDMYETLDKDLAALPKGATIEFIPSSQFASKYADVLSYVTVKSIKGQYVLKPRSPYDASKIAAILGNNIEGNQESGYKFKRAA